jgi:glycosyltransferase involved in cell wall biosynthesis
MSVPQVSILLPTYNRAAFLPAAFESIRAQTFPDWELVVVDDGSTDNTRDLVEELRNVVSQPVRYIHQQNQGVYGARMTGLEAAGGEHVAFFDSDDLWLPHHLVDCVAALTNHPEVGWAYGACRMQDAATGRIIEESTFRPGGIDRPFLGLRTRTAGRLRIIDDPRTWDVAVIHGLFCGFQCSVIRRSVFEAPVFRKRYRMRIGEDVAMIMMAVKTGCRFAYYDAVHTIYRVHGDHTSAAGGAGGIEKKLANELSMAEGWEEVSRDLGLTKSEWRSVHRALGESYFWRIGYALLWQNGKRREALDAFRRGIRHRPWHLPYWKTFSLALVRAKWHPEKVPSSAVRV